MIFREARWIAAALRHVPSDELFPLLNVGSQSDEFRTRTQPWIQREVFGPLERRGRVIHLDLEAGKGVDIAGDLLDPRVIAAVQERGVRSVICANVLEHVPDAERFAGVLASIVPHGGHLLVTGPRAFPHHPDPIDTMFRPTPAELAALFPGFTCEKSAVVQSTLIAYLVRRFIESPRDFVRSVRTGGGGSSNEFRAWLFRRVSATCALFRKPAGATAGTPPAPLPE
jgi:hypothetical protein